jgi:hypothetical protein
MLTLQRANVAVGDSRSAAASAYHRVDSDRFDYVEKAESSGSRSQSTISDAVCWDSPFAHDSLGDTVIHFDRVRCFICQ